jgi:hypothetical protein
MKWIVAAAVLAALAGAAEAAPKPGDKVTVEACAYPGVTIPCLMIKDADGVYNVTGANPKPPLDTVIRLRGTVTDKVSICQQGVVLDQITWSETGRKCPK